MSFHHMTQPQIEEYLREQMTVILTTIGSDGLPLATPLWYVWLDGAIYIGTGADSHKVRNIRRDNRVCCLVESGVNYRDLKSVVMRGHCEVLEGQSDEVQRAQAALAAKYAAAREGASQARPARPGRGSGRVMLKVVPEKVTSWDYAKLF